MFMACLQTILQIHFLDVQKKLRQGRTPARDGTRMEEHTERLLLSDKPETVSILTDSKHCATSYTYL